ncbi:MAG: hypothetical protein M9894_14475 [Planctomycetes bacterium]|nr:hypothetical protein [Planctomycetota bacterium]
MGGRRDRDPDDDRIKFPFGHSVEGPLDELLDSGAGPLPLDSGEGPLRLDSDERLLPLDSDERPLPLDTDEGSLPLDSDEGALPPTSGAGPLPRRRTNEVVYESAEGPVPWAPDFPTVIGDPDSGDEVEEDDDEPEALSPSEVGRLIDLEADQRPSRRLFDPIAGPPRAPAPSGRSPAAGPPADPFAPPAPTPEARVRSEVPTQRVDPREVDAAAGPPTFVTGGGPGPRVPGTPSGRHVTPLGPRPPATPSGRQPAARPIAADDPATLHTLVPAGPAPPPPRSLGPPPPATPSGWQPAAAPLAPADPATLHTLVPTRPAPPPPPGPGDGEVPTQAPAYAARNPFDSEDMSLDGAPPIVLPHRPAGPSDLERTHPHSAPDLPGSGDLTASVSLEASDDALGWPSGSSPTLETLESGAGQGSSVASPLLRGVVSDEGPGLGDEASEEPSRALAYPRGLDAGEDSSMEALGRRTAELDISDLVVGSGKRRLFEDSDITPIPDFADLVGSTEGPVTGLLDSQEREPLEAGPAPPDGATSPSLRLVQVSVERVVGLWEGDAAWVLASLGGALLGPIFLYFGWEYYGLPLELRKGHPLDHVLRPGGSVGVVFGLLGAGLFLLNLTYVLRRRLGLLKRWISLRVWLNAHFICGLTGGSFIFAHSALLANNDVARISSLAIGVAIASGIFGRYVLSHLPRRRDGEGPELAEREHVAARLVELRRQLRTRLSNQPDLRDAALAALTTDAVSQVSGVGDDDDGGPVRARPRGILYIGPLILGDLVAAARWVALSMKVRGLLRRSDDPQLRKVLNETLALAKVQRLEQRMAQVEAVQDLMDTWRGVHFIVALIVISTMVLHVKIVLTYGRLAWLGP